MKIAVIGAGAMGSLFGALLAEGGHEVWLCDIWQDHIKALKQNGLKIEWEGQARNVRLNATSDPRYRREHATTATQHLSCEIGRFHACT